jgi:peptidoglycan-associated lipoprotein
MKTKMLTVLTSAALGVALSGCAASKGAYSGNIQDDAAASASDSAAVVAQEEAGSIQPDFLSPAKPLDDERGNPKSLLAKRLIHFDYDKSVVPPDAITLIEAHADFMTRNPNVNILVAGHADERGSTEYNLALGQRRSNAVRDIFVSFGIAAGRIEALSFGETDPINPASTEDAWRENRRAELRYSDE